MPLFGKIVTLLPMGRVFCIANQKGGVGKTTTAISLADGLAKSSARTLLIDFDPQCNAVSGLGIPPLGTSPYIAGFNLREVIVPAKTRNLDVLPGSRKIAEVDMLLRSQPEEAERILRQIQEIAADYDFVLFDCPPSLGHLTQLALFASAEVLIPMQCEYYAMEGLTHMGAMVKKVAAQKPEDLAFAGILLTMYDAGVELTHEVESEVRKFFGENVFDVVIPRDAAVSEAQAHGVPIIDYAPRCRAARAYIELCMDILDHRAE